MWRTIVVAVVAMCTPTVAFAHDPPVERLPVLGLEYAKHGEDEKAVAAWERWLAEVADPPAAVEGPVRKNLGTLLERQGRLAAAMYEWSVAMRLRPSDAELRGWARELEGRLRARGYCAVPLEFSGRPDLLLLDRGRVPGPEAHMTWWFRPGEHRIDAVVGGERTARSVSVSCDAPGATIRVSAEPQTASAWPYVLMGSGVALAVLGGVTYWVAVEQGTALDDEFRPRATVSTRAEAEALKAEYDRRWVDEVEPWNVTSWALWGAGGAVLAGGVIWWALGGGEASDPVDAAWQPVVWPGGGGGVVRVRW